MCDCSSIGSYWYVRICVNVLMMAVAIMAMIAIVMPAVTMTGSSDVMMV